MAKVQGKKAGSAGRKGAAKSVKKVVAKAKQAVSKARKAVTPKKAAAKPARKTSPKPQPKPAKRKAIPVKAGKAPAKQGKVASAAKKAKAAVKKVVSRVTPAKAKKAAAPPARTAAARPQPPAKKSAGKATGKGVGKAVTPPPPPTPPPATPVAAPPSAEADKKRGRRARTRIISSGAPAAAWLTSEKPRPASFIPAPPRAEAPAAIAAPPASSDRLIRPEDLEHTDIRTVPVRVDIEQGAGRFYVIPNPIEVSARAGEGVEWDFRYIGGADVTVEEIVIELPKPSPFAQAVYRTRKPGGARPHRQLSDRVLGGASGGRFEYTIRAMSAFKTEVASAKAWLTIAG